MDSEHLTGLNEAELKALAISKLAPAAQARLDELLQANARGELLPDDQPVLDRLLDEVDCLTAVKTRAAYTLQMNQSLFDGLDSDV